MCVFFQCKRIVTAIFFILSFAVNAEIDYEPNNNFEDAQPILVGVEAQSHKFDYAGDEDWMVFYAQKGELYDIEIESTSVGKGINPAIELYNDKREIELSLHDINFSGEGELISWGPAPSDGVYYIKVTNTKTDYDTNVSYKIVVYSPVGTQIGFLTGVVTDQCTQRPIRSAGVISRGDQELSQERGIYNMSLIFGQRNVTALIEGYITQTKEIYVKNIVATTLNFELRPSDGCSAISATEQIEIDQLKQQAIAVYDDSKGVLMIDDIRVRDNIFSVGLTRAEDSSFYISFLENLTVGKSESPAVYDFNSLEVNIPKVFAYNKLYAVQLKHDDSGGYIVQKADPVKK